MNSARLSAGAIALAALVQLAACGDHARDCGDCGGGRPDAATPVAEATPEAINGWREYPLRDGVVTMQAEAPRSDTVDVPVPAGEWLEYKLGMKAGDTVVYAISYDGLTHPGLLTVEFHGHTEKGADGNGDLMFYSKTTGVSENGAFTAPWDGVHGWYIKNDSGALVTAKLSVAGFYELIGTGK